MANPNAPFGLRPIRHSTGGDHTRFSDDYTIADQYATALYMGDPVACTGTGKNIGIATAGSSQVITGVFWGCEYVDAIGETRFSKYWPASQVTNTAFPVKAFVIDDPNIIFEVQMATMAAADVRQLANLVAGTGDVPTGRSGWYAAAPVTTENQLKILALGRGTNPGAVPNAYGTYAVAEVLIAYHELRGNCIEI